MDGNYDILSLERLEESAAALAKYNQSLANDGQSLDYAMKTILENWQNDDGGEDIESISESLAEILKTMTNEVQPTITKYVNIINTIVAETKRNQSGSVY